jgi:hypothetical protein
LPLLLEFHIMTLWIVTSYTRTDEVNYYSDFRLTSMVTGRDAGDTRFFLRFELIPSPCYHISSYNRRPTCQNL